MVKHEPWSPTSNDPSSAGSSGRTPGGTAKPPPPLPPAVQAAAEKGNIGPEELKIVFRSIDKDGSGEISHQELRQALWSLTGTKPTKAVVQVIMADIDVDDSGAVDEDEFIEFFTTVMDLKNLRENMQQGEQKAVGILWFVNVYGCVCIVATAAFYLTEIQSDNPDFGGNWGLFIFGMMSCVWLIFRVFIPLLMARVSYWVPILREFNSWFQLHKRRCMRSLKNLFHRAKHSILRREGKPPQEPASPTSPISPTVLALRAMMSFRRGAKPAVETPYQAENYEDAAEYQSAQPPLHTFKLLQNAKVHVLPERTFKNPSQVAWEQSKTQGTSSAFAVDKPVYYLPYNRWDGGDLKAKEEPVPAWEDPSSPSSPHQRRSFPALPAPPRDDSPAAKTLRALAAPQQESSPQHHTGPSRFKALAAGEATANLEEQPDHDEAEPTSPPSSPTKALEKRQQMREAQAAAPTLAERRGKNAPLAVDVPKRG